MLTIKVRENRVRRSLVKGGYYLRKIPAETSLLIYSDYESRYQIVSDNFAIFEDGIMLDEVEQFAAERSGSKSLM